MCEWLTVKVGTSGHHDNTPGHRQAEAQVVGAPFKAHLLGRKLIGGDEALLAQLLILITCTPPTALSRRQAHCCVPIPGLSEGARSTARLLGATGQTLLSGRLPKKSMAWQGASFFNFACPRAVWHGRLHPS